MNLNETQKSILEQANRSAIQQVISRLQDNWVKGDWLNPNNYYRTDASRKVQQDSRNGKITNHHHLADYVAASTIIHCFDGWSYLARALEAEMAGDPDAARHLGYYAELRAAMSLLAGEGVGLFNTDHIVVVSENKCKLFERMGTHAIAWKALEYWGGLPNSAKTLFRTIKPEGHFLQDWFTNFGGSAEFLAFEWLKQWGLDLSRLSDDRNARNIASYSPTAFTSSGPRSFKKTVIAVAQFWEMCGPESEGGFPILDRHILRRSLEMLFMHVAGRSRRQAKNKYLNQISRMLDSLNLTDEARLRLKKFLNYESMNFIPQLFTDADKTSLPNHIDHSKQVLARATLLLRVATGALSDLFHGSNLELYSDLSFWWSQASVRRCLWPTDGQPQSFIDLWEDVDYALYETEQWIDENTNRPKCYYSFRDEKSKFAMTLTTTERIFLWGVS